MMNQYKNMKVIVTCRTDYMIQKDITENLKLEDAVSQKEDSSMENEEKFDNKIA